MNTQEFGKFVAYKDAALILPFIEGRGLPHDFSRNKNDSYFSNAKWILFGNKFDNNKVLISNDDSLNIKTPSIFVGLKVNADSNGSKTWCICVKDYAYGIWFDHVIPGGTTMYINDGTSWYNSRSIRLKRGFQYLFGSFDGINVLIKSLDKHLSNSNVNQVNIQFSLSPFGLGIRPAAKIDILYKSIIFDIKVWSRVLSDSEQKSVYYYSNQNKNSKPTAITKKGCFLAVKNTGVEVDGKLTSCCGI